MRILRFHYTAIMGLLLLISLFPTELSGQSSSLDSLHFRWGAVYFTPREEALARSTAKKVSHTLDQIEGDLQLTPHTSFTVIIAPTKEIYTEYSGYLPDWSAGATNLSSNRIILKSPKLGRTNIWDYDQTLRHETMHIVLGQNVDPTRIPRWLSEGLAMIIGGQQSLHQVYTLSQAVVQDNLISLGELEMLLQFDRPKATLAYAECISAVRFLQSQFPPGTLTKIFTGMNRSDASFAREFEQETGLPISYFEYHWQQHLTSKYRWITMMGSDTALWIFFTLLVIVGYLLIRWRNRKKLQSWQQEEDQVDSGTDWDYEYMPDEDEEWRGDIH